MSIASRAQAAFDSAHYQLAVDLYERAIAEQPELAHTYDFGLARARKQLSLAKKSSPSPDTIETIRTAPSATSESGRTSGDDLSLIDLHHIIDRFKNENQGASQSSHPLVSILMIAHNCADFIEESVTSVLRQKWPNLELIVIDDASPDNTWDILKRLMNSVANLRCHRNNSRRGSIPSTKYAFSLAKGEYLFFQGARDLSHPERIAIMMSELVQPNVVAVRGTYSLVEAPSTKVLLSYGAITQLGIKTIGFHRQAFEESNLLSCNYGDENEFNFRLDTWANEKGFNISKLDLPLYFQTVLQQLPHTEVLTSGNHQNSGNDFSYEDTRKSAYAIQHDNSGIEDFHQNSRFPAHPNMIAAPSLVSGFAPRAQPVVVSICSIPSRAELLRQVLASLSPQVDAMHVYLDRYDSVPDFVRNCHPQVKVYLSKDHPGLRDNGKFLAFSTLAEDCYYFTADDDIVYPPDYVASMVRRIEDYERQAVIGVHGVLLPEQAEGYFTSFRKVHMFKKELERDALVNNLGTGTVAFHSGLLHGLDLTHFGTPGMADLHLSVFCKQRDIPMVALARPEDWLQELPSPNTSLYNEFRQADDQQSALIRAHKPWGYAAISKAVAGASMRATKPDTGERLQRLIPILHACLK